ncbi:MAG TPA: RluA family pseudouridine synthase [Myxococcales bacterium]|nr:RluA family pseudouridine synthase [Myxococcales bacterium]
MRLDQYLAKLKPEITRSQLKGLIEEGAVLVNGAGAKPARKLRAGDHVDLTPRATRPARALPEALPLKILWEDADVVVVDKPAGMVVHPAGALVSGTLVNALLHRCPDLGPIGGELRPGIVHRLDKDTSGALVVAKNEPSLVALQAAFKARTVEKRYAALVHGSPAARGSFDTPYGRHPRDRVRYTTRVSATRRARLEWEVREAFAGVAFLDVALLTGRTHQIRVQFAEAGFPLLADALYGGTRRERRLIGSPAALAADALARQALHARLLAFPHPRRREVIRVEAPLPEDFERALAILRSAG